MWRKLNLLTFAYGVIVFLWLTPDETGWLVIPLGVSGMIILTLHAAARWNHQLASLPQRLRFCLLGGVIGAGSTLATAGLMLFKNGLHNHIYPDYPLLVIVGILQRLPAWALAGTLIGLALALLFPSPSAHQQQHDEQAHRREQQPIDPV
jgi:hypothetical protein